MANNKPVRWTCLNSKTAYTSEYFQVHNDLIRLPSGSTMSYDWYSAKDFCVIVALTRGRLIMIDNYRYPADDWYLELPAGHIEGGETPVQAAARELEEETGYRPRGLKYLQWYYVSSRSLQKGHILYSNECTKTNTKREESELQRVKLVTPHYLESKIKSGFVRHAATIVAYGVAKSQGLI